VQRRRIPFSKLLLQLVFRIAKTYKSVYVAAILTSLVQVGLDLMPTEIEPKTLRKLTITSFSRAYTLFGGLSLS
jgi:hypothetical protein